MIMRTSRLSTTDSLAIRPTIFPTMRMHRRMDGIVPSGGGAEEVDRLRLLASRRQERLQMRRLRSWMAKRGI